MNVELVQYLVIISVVIASCLLHALLIKKSLFSQLDKSFSQRLIINSVFYMILAFSALILSAYFVLFDTISGMCATFLLRAKFFDRI